MKFPEKSFQFLEKLIQNNQREWFKERKEQYDRCKELNGRFFQEVTLNMQVFDEIENTKQFRIYRDLRFTKDKTPYKSHFAARFIRRGKARRGTYYLHIAPDNRSFCAGGFYGPNREDLLRIRKEFEFDDNPIRNILNAKELKTQFPDGLQGDELKTSPRDFDRNHPAIDLIRKKQFFLKKTFSDKELFDDNFSERIAELFRVMKPYLDYMSEVVTTDLNGRSLL